MRGCKSHTGPTPTPPGMVTAKQGGGCSLAMMMKALAVSDRPPQMRSKVENSARLQAGTHQHQPQHQHQYRHHYIPHPWVDIDMLDPSLNKSGPSCVALSKPSQQQTSRLHTRCQAMSEASSKFPGPSSDLTDHQQAPHEIKGMPSHTSAHCTPAAASSHSITSMHSSHPRQVK